MRRVYISDQWTIKQFHTRQPPSRLRSDRVKVDSGQWTNSEIQLPSSQITLLLDIIDRERGKVGQIVILEKKYTFFLHFHSYWSPRARNPKTKKKSRKIRYHSSPCTCKIHPNLSGTTWKITIPECIQFLSRPMWYWKPEAIKSFSHAKLI